jgi:hypothetical protein
MFVPVAQLPGRRVADPDHDPGRGSSSRATHMDIWTELVEHLAQPALLAVILLCSCLSLSGPDRPQ